MFVDYIPGVEEYSNKLNIFLGILEVGSQSPWEKYFFLCMVTKKLLLVGRPESVIIHRISSLQESLKCNDRILLFSQSLFTLNLIEDFLKKKKLTNVEVGVYCLSI